MQPLWLALTILGPHLLQAKLALANLLSLLARRAAVSFSNTLPTRHLLANPYVPSLRPCALARARGHDLPIKGISPIPSLGLLHLKKVTADGQNAWPAHQHCATARSQGQATIDIISFTLFSYGAHAAICPP